MSVKFKVHQKYFNGSTKDPNPEYVCVGIDFDEKQNKHFAFFRNAGSFVILVIKHRSNGDEYTDQCNGFYKIDAKNLLNKA